MHTYVTELNHHWSGNGLLTVLQQATTCVSVYLLAMKALGTYFNDNDIWVKIYFLYENSLENMSF